MILIDGKFACYTIEDEGRTKKKWGETRIPEGEYEIGLRTEGRFHDRYEKKYAKVPGFHKGMLCIYNEPNWMLKNKGMQFQFILIHTGNDDDDTAGCILPGSVAYNDRNWVAGSTDAYKVIYPQIAHAISLGEKVKFVVREVAK